MRQEIGEYLELPGKVVLIEPITTEAATKEIQEIIDRQQQNNRLTLGEIPEGEEKDRLRTLFRALGLDVGF